MYRGKLTAGETAVILRDLLARVGSGDEDNGPPDKALEPLLSSLAYAVDAAEAIDLLPVAILPVWSFLIELLGVSLYVELRQGVQSPWQRVVSKGRTEVHLGGFYIVTERTRKGGSGKSVRS